MWLICASSAARLGAKWELRKVVAASSRWISSISSKDDDADARVLWPRGMVHAVRACVCVCRQCYVICCMLCLCDYAISDSIHLQRVDFA